MSIKFKFQEDYNKLSVNCPPLEYTAQIVNPAYRWVFDSIEKIFNLNTTKILRDF